MRYTGCRVSSLAFAFNAAEGWVTYTANLQGKISTKVTAVNPAQVEEKAFEGWWMTITSTNYAARVVSGEITITRELHLVNTGNNTQDTLEIVPGPLNFEGRLVMAFDSMVDYDSFKSHLTQSLVITFNDGQGGASNRQLVFTLTSGNFGNGPLEIDMGNQGVLAALSILGVHNTTDLGQGTVTLVNGRLADYSNVHTAFPIAANVS